jgi:hypothetical protein
MVLHKLKLLEQTRQVGLQGLLLLLSVAHEVRLAFTTGFGVSSYNS